MNLTENFDVFSFFMKIQAGSRTIDDDIRGKFGGKSLEKKNVESNQTITIFVAMG